MATEHQNMRRMPRPPTPEDASGQPTITLSGLSYQVCPSAPSDIHKFSTAASYERLLLHQIPSPSLCLGEIFQAWPPSPKKTSPIAHRASRASKFHSSPNDNRNSLATLVDFGDWISEQSHQRPPSLLPPTPHVFRQAVSVRNTESVQCQLRSTSTCLPNHKITANHKRDLNPGRMHELCSQMEEISFTPQPDSIPPSRLITPVPSLTNSQRSTFSSTTAIRDVLATTIGELTSSCDSTSTSVSQASKGTAIAHTTKTLSYYNKQLLPFSDNSTLCVSNLPSSPSTSIKYYPSRPAPRPPSKSTKPLTPQLQSTQNEISYFEWDDDETTDDRSLESRLLRMKNRLTDMRASERSTAGAPSQRQFRLRGQQTSPLLSPELHKQLNNKSLTRTPPRQGPDIRPQSDARNERRRTCSSDLEGVSLPLQLLATPAVPCTAAAAKLIPTLPWAKRPLSTKKRKLNDGLTLAAHCESERRKKARLGVGVTGVRRWVRRVLSGRREIV